MKRLFVLVLALVLMVGISSAVSAMEIEPLGRGGGWPGGPKNPPQPDPVVTLDEAIICIEAENPLYGSIEGLPGVCIPLGEFEGTKNASLSGDVEFSIKSNAFLKVTLDLDKPLTHTQYANEELSTHVRMRQRVGSNFTNRLSVFHQWGNQGNKASDSYTMADLVGGQASGRGIRNYRFDIQGQLGDVHEQAAGTYKASVIVTLAAP